MEILLIDDDIELSHLPICHVPSQALKLIYQRTFDMILLNIMLTARISAAQRRNRTQALLSLTMQQSAVPGVYEHYRIRPKSRDITVDEDFIYTVRSHGYMLCGEWCIPRNKGLT